MRAMVRVLLFVGGKFISVMLCKTQIVDVTSCKTLFLMRMMHGDDNDAGDGRECCFYDFPYISRLLGLPCSTRLIVVVS